MKNTKVAIIGCGNLGLSILGGLLDNKDIPTKNITITRRNTESIAHYTENGVNVTNDNQAAVKNSDVIILAVKPYNIIEIVSGLSSVIDSKKHTIISTATGVTMDEISTAIGKKTPIYRAMPNTAADVGESVTCICGTNESKENYQVVESLFNCIGSTIRINEDLMEAATVLGACGIAYVLRFIRAMVQGGIQIGFDAKTAANIVNQTVKGASELLIQNGQHPEFEIDIVTTPKGCTIVGLNEMEHNGFSSSLIKGIVASHEKI